MIEVISVRFRGGCKSYFFDPQGLSVPEGEQVVVETAQGAEIGTCVRTNHAVEDHAVIQPLRPVRRIAGEEDKRTAEKNRQREKEAMIVCEKKIAAHKLEMKLVDVECSFEGNKIIFFFTADGRVDFRELVKDLAGVFHARTGAAPDWRARRGENAGRPGYLRPALLLQAVSGGFPTRCPSKWPKRRISV